MTSLPRPILVGIGAAWAAAIGAQVAGVAALANHDSLLVGDGPPFVLAALIALLAWQVMIAAMMLPSSLPLIRLFDAVSERQERPGRMRAAFLGGYVVVWTAFGAQAFLGDVGVHTMVDSFPWLRHHSWLIAGGVLAMAGAFQFSNLKDQCLSKCRQPGPYLMSHYRRGSGGAFRLGLGHGLYCLGCCWALMLVMFAAGVAMLWWMAALTAVMVYEKTGRHGEAVTPVVGAALLLLAALTMVYS